MNMGCRSKTPERSQNALYRPLAGLMPADCRFAHPPLRPLSRKRPKVFVLESYHITHSRERDFGSVGSLNSLCLSLCRAKSTSIQFDNFSSI